jgi:spore maturation protein CgeB
MNYSILRIYNIPYLNVFSQFKKNNQHSNNYVKLKNKFLSQKISYSNSFSINMKKLNNISDEIIYNFNFLQKLWDPYSKNLNNFKILLSQIEEFKPDVLFFQGNLPFSITELKKLKLNFPSIKKYIMHFGFQVPLEILQEIDIKLIASPHLFKLYKKEIKNLHLIYHYFDEDVFNYIKKKDKENFLIFCGKTGSDRNKDHFSRYHLLDRICKNFDIKCYSQEKFKKENSSLSKYHSINFFLKKIAKKEIFLHDKYARNIFDPVFGIEMYEKIINSYAVLNSHVDLNKNKINFSANMRLFETTGVGTAIITENSKNIYEIFDKDNVIVYKDEEDLKNKIYYYRNNLNELIEIGKKGQEHTIKFHTAKIRVKEINNLILNYL